MRTIAILGGTGDQGYGLALRWGKVGQHIIIGSRQAPKAEDAAKRVLETLGAGEYRIEGMANPDAAARADVTVLTVPFAGSADIVKSVRDHLKDGTYFIDVTVPLATVHGGRATRMVGVWEGSAAEQTRALLPKGIKLASAFQNTSATVLEDLSQEVDCDIITCGEADAKLVVRELVDLIPGCRYVDGGPIENSRLVEPITALLIGLNIRHKVHGSGIRITGLEAGH
ncbi:MAG TPA: NADPH-dependent F420 reductase [Dehalococcoidia bacterium]|nr:NADPH-dependent F420 reductase [Dehalococcoidia bacterium]